MDFVAAKCAYDITNGSTSGSVTQVYELKLAQNLDNYQPIVNTAQ